MQQLSTIKYIQQTHQRKKSINNKMNFLQPVYICRHISIGIVFSEHVYATMLILHMIIKEKKYKQ
jgi:hypothetical protein